MPKMKPNPDMSTPKFEHGGGERGGRGSDDHGTISCSKINWKLECQITKGASSMDFCSAFVILSICLRVESQTFDGFFFLFFILLITTTLIKIPKPIKKNKRKKITKAYI